MYFHCKASVQNLEEKVKQITNNGNIFCVSYYNPRSQYQDRNICRVATNYLRKIIDNNKKKFDENKVKEVELNEKRGKVLIIAELKK